MQLVAVGNHSYLEWLPNRLIVPWVSRSFKALGYFRRLWHWKSLRSLKGEPASRKRTSIAAHSRTDSTVHNELNKRWWYCYMFRFTHFLVGDIPSSSYGKSWGIHIRDRSTSWKREESFMKGRNYGYQAKLCSCRWTPMLLYFQYF